MKGYVRIDQNVHPRVSYLMNLDVFFQLSARVAAALERLKELYSFVRQILTPFKRLSIHSTLVRCYRPANFYIVQ